MSIRFDRFEFACPPLMKTDWIVCLVQKLEMGFSGSNGAGVYNWFDDKEVRLPRVSMVRNPVDWLVEVFHYLDLGKGLAPIQLARFYDVYCQLPKQERGVEQFFDSYVEKIPGEISKLFDSYQSDTRIRLEDMPWCFLELAESFGTKVESNGYNWEGANYFARPSSADRIMETERELCEMFDYY